MNPSEIIGAIYIDDLNQINYHIMKENVNYAILKKMSSTFYLNVRYIMTLENY